jgi:RimJ/RimL family protein N-acetyltransferase
MRPKKVTGTKCYLSPLEKKDAEKFYQWMNDLGTTVYLNAWHNIMTLEQENKFIETVTGTVTKNYVLGIIDIKTDEMIGSTGFHKVDEMNRHAELGVVIGDIGSRGKGIGFEATQLMLDFGFHAMNLNNIYLRVYSFNKRAINLYKKIGFKKIGIHREAKIISDKKYNVILMDMVLSEFNAESKVLGLVK